MDNTEPASPRPFAYFTRSDNTRAQVGGSAGCFGTDGEIRRITGYTAILYSEYGCKGNVLARCQGDVEFSPALNTRSISLVKIA